MQPSTNYLSYESTGYFSKIVSDYLSQSPNLQPFYQHIPDLAGIKNAIAARKNFNTPRKLLVDVLIDQYKGLSNTEKATAQISLLANENTFTVTTAHQPNIFTGPLYFIYKIIHAIKLANELNALLPEAKFIPVYYMGSEDADLDELGYVHVGGEKLVWATKQTGAVGRMKVDKSLIKLIQSIHGQAGVWPHGEALTNLFATCYAEGKSIQQATLELVHHLFGDEGLVVLIPDNKNLKSAFQPIVARELQEGFSHKMVAATINDLSKNYKVQAGGRDINLFYLKDDRRERIEKEGDVYVVKSLGLQFSKEEILQESIDHPDRFSANVILRGAFQETVLPNIAFIGGGGELAYWLELKQVFDAAKIPYPVLLLRNSFLQVKIEQAARWEQMGFAEADLFRDAFSLTNELVKKESTHQLNLADELALAHSLYAQLEKKSAAVESSLTMHVASLEKKAVKKIIELEKKILRAEREKFSIQQGQIVKIKEALFPANSLQERVDNFSLYYAKEGKLWLEEIYRASHGISKGFGIITR
jgi:bacillithiol biosynthesis cysteine-adding enzyme BshC